MCARGGIGRRAGFRSRSLGVQVQFLSGAPLIKARFCRAFSRYKIENWQTHRIGTSAVFLCNKHSLRKIRQSCEPCNTLFRNGDSRCSCTHICREAQPNDEFYTQRCSRIPRTSVIQYICGKAYLSLPGRPSSFSARK